MHDNALVVLRINQSWLIYLKIVNKKVRFNLLVSLVNNAVLTSVTHVVLLLNKPTKYYCSTSLPRIWSDLWTIQVDRRLQFGTSYNSSARFASLIERGERVKEQKLTVWCAGKRYHGGSICVCVHISF